MARLDGPDNALLIKEDGIVVDISRESSIVKIHIKSRAKLIVLEGPDGVGKTTQVKLLEEWFKERKEEVVTMAFPDRTTTTGKLINEFLTNKTEIEPHVLHLLFVANRWEKAAIIEKHLYQGTHVILDRYSYSGLCYGVAAHNLHKAWCQGPEIGLPEPDIVFFLLPSGDRKEIVTDKPERYDKVETQRKVVEMFRKTAEDYLTPHSMKKVIINVTAINIERDGIYVMKDRNSVLGEITGAIIGKTE